MTNSIFIIPIEPIEQRYSKQWYEHIPKLLAANASARNLKVNIVTVPGQSVEDVTTPGAFLDFGQTNFYKGTQVAHISQLFSSGKVQAGDKFLVTDAWNFAITAIRYMSDLMDIPVEIHSIWHAGAYDPSDILGYKMRKDWPKHQERAWFYSSDFNYFGSEFHKDMFLKNLKIDLSHHKKAILSGQPYEYVANFCYDNFFNKKKRTKTIVFTHRLNDDKQPEIFRDLVEALPKRWTYVITQDNKFTKDEYYEVLSQCKIAFSCSLHENLGVGQMESVLCGNIPVVPSRASYSEIYNEKFVYPTGWTTSFDEYLKHKDQLINFISNLMNDYDKIKKAELVDQIDLIKTKYMNSQVMINNLLTFKDNSTIIGQNDK